MILEKAGGKTRLKREPGEKTRFLQRLARIEGQVRGLRQMVEDDRYCSEQLQQINAVIAALREVALMAISDQITTQIGGMAAASPEAQDVPELIDLLRATFRLV